MKKLFWIDQYGNVLHHSIAEMKLLFADVKGIKQLSWDRMHLLEAYELNKGYKSHDPLTKCERDFFKRIKQPSTIFNVANLRRWGFFHVTEGCLK